MALITFHLGDFRNVIVPFDKKQLIIVFDHFQSDKINPFLVCFHQSPVTTCAQISLRSFPLYFVMLYISFTKALKWDTMATPTTLPKTIMF